jgi:hypothetical protein
MTLIHVLWDVNSNRNLEWELQGRHSPWRSSLSSKLELYLGLFVIFAIRVGIPHSICHYLMHKLVPHYPDSSHLIPSTLTALAILVPVSSVVSLLTVTTLALAVPSLRRLLLRWLAVSLLRVRYLVSLLVSSRERIVVTRLEARRWWRAVAWLLVSLLLVTLLLVARLLVSWLLVCRLLVPAVPLCRRARSLRWSSVARSAGGAVFVDVS